MLLYHFLFVLCFLFYFYFISTKASHIASFYTKLTGLSSLVLLFVYWCLLFPFPQILVSCCPFAVEKNCAKRSPISGRDWGGILKSAGRSFKLHPRCLFALLNRGRRGTLSGLSGLGAGTRKVNQNCLSEDEAILNYAKGSPFSGSLVCALGRRWLKKRLPTHRGSCFLALLRVPCTCLQQQLCWHSWGVENWGSERKGFLEQNSVLMPSFTLNGSLEIWRDYSTSRSIADAVISHFH